MDAENEARSLSDAIIDLPKTLMGTGGVFALAACSGCQTSSECGVGCEGGIGCETGCQAGCQSNCESCQGCQGCQGCEGWYCETYCESVCQGCQVSCQSSICETVCEYNCQSGQVVTYTASATVTFDANGGYVSPPSASGSASTTSQYGAYVNITFPTPTRSGFVFLYWILDGNTSQYNGGQTYGVWGDVGGVTYTARAQWRTGIAPWSWTASNGSATAAQTQQFYNVLRGDALPENGFSHLVWNDLVDKASAVVTAYGRSWYRYEGLGVSGCKAAAGDGFGAAKYNEVRYNVGAIISTGIADKFSGDEVFGYYVTTLTDTINQIISTYL